MGILKNKKAMTISAVAIAAVVGIGGMTLHANAALKVNSYAASTDTIVKIVEVNGNVVSDNTASVYSNINGKIATVNYKVGDYVKKGDTIISYDNDDINQKIALAEYSMQESFGAYDNIIQSGGRSAGLYSEAKNTLNTLETQINDTQAAIDNLNRNITARRAAIAEYGANLQISAIDWSDNPDSSEYENLQKLIATNSYDQQFDPEVLRMQEELTALTTQLSSYRELKSQMISQQATGYAGLITEGTKEQIEAAKAAGELSTNDEVSNLNAALDGVKADFDGVITAIGVSENETVGDGTLLFTIESTEDVVIRVNVNKYDILDIEEGQPTNCTIKGKDYTGKISRIEHMTGQGESANIGVEVSLDEPDENIILGLETKVKVTTASLDNVLTIPMDALCMDDTSEYVYIMEENEAKRRNVETGVKNDDYVQILYGLENGETVIWNEETDLTDGMSVRAE